MKVIIIRAGALGDTLCLMPAIELLRRHAEITLIGRYPGIEVLSPYVKRVIDYETCGMHLLFSNETEIGDTLNLPPHDRIIIFTTRKGNILMKNLKAIYPESKIYIYPPFPEKKDIHISWHMAECINRAGIPCEPAEAIRVATDRALFTGCQDNKDKSIDVLIHPGSGSLKKNLAPEFWMDVISKIEFRKISLLFGPAEEGIFGVFQKFITRRNIEYFISPSIQELINIIASCKIYTGHDSGVTHLSSMLGKRTIAIFPRNNIKTWRPLGPDVSIFEKENVTPEMILKELER